MIIPLAYGLMHGWSLSTILLLAFIRISLDCLDGAVARSCNLYSELGKILDSASDLITVLTLLVVVVYTVGKKKGFNSSYFKMITMLLLLALGIYIYTTFYCYNDKLKESHIARFMHDNTVLTVPLTALGAWWMVRA